MDIFLINNGKKYTYTDLVNSINSSNLYYPLYRSDDIFDYFLNLIKALSCNKSLVLLDSDINPSEIDNLDESNVNIAVPVDGVLFENGKELVNAIQHSSSEITIFTSGTTGQPKKVVHTVASLTRNVRIGEKYKGQIWAYAYNPTHMAGLQVFFQAFENLNTLVNVFNKQRNDIYGLIAEHGITHISATPTFYRMLLPFEREYKSVVRVTLGGEKSDQHLYDSIRTMFPVAKINNVYASTEAGSLFAAKGECFMIPGELRGKFKVIDEELLIHKSLLGKSDSFRLDGDYYHSGDLIEWKDKEQGLFLFKSRKNELINVGGYKVNPGEVENVLLAMNGIKQAIVYGKANSVLGNILCADIQLEEGSHLSDIEIRMALHSQLQDFKIPRRIKFVEQMQLTRTGKLKRS